MWIGLGAVAVVLAVLALTGEPRLGGSPELAQPSGISADGGIPPRPDDAFLLIVEYVIDGDTIKATVDEPNGVITTTERVSVRVIGIDTPELRPQPECWAEEATDHLSAMLPEGSRVWAAPDREWYDRYDRALLYLWTEDGTFINQRMVATGDAASMEVRPNDSYAALFAATEAAARDAGLGRWSACAA